MIDLAGTELDLSEIQKVLDDYVSKSSKRDEIPGAAFAVTQSRGDGSNTYYFQAGTCKFDTYEPFTKNTICFIASMTKLVTSIAAMQVVERGLVGLDDDLGRIISALSGLDVLQGFNANEEPVSTLQVKPITLRHLLSHTSGFGYDVWDPDLIKWQKSTGTSTNANSFSLESLKIPLKFQPGTDWIYGISLDWADHVVETLSGFSLEDYMQLNIFKPLGMTSTTFRISKHPELESARADIGLRSTPQGPVVLGANYKPDTTPMDCGGVGLNSTASDYIKLLNSLLSNDCKILKPETAQELLTWQIPYSTSVQSQFFGEHNHIFAPEFALSTPVGYGLCGAINQVDIPGKRCAGSVMWHGIANCRWWLDRKSGIAGTLFVQLLPPGDAAVSELYDQLERAVYWLFGDL